MPCYKDRTYCGFYRKCKKGNNCERALTYDVQSKARAIRLPVSQFAEEPQCFESTSRKK